MDEIRKKLENDGWKQFEIDQFLGALETLAVQNNRTVKEEYDHFINGFQICTFNR